MTSYSLASAAVRRARRHSQPRRRPDGTGRHGLVRIARRHRHARALVWRLRIHRHRRHRQRRPARVWTRIRVDGDGRPARRLGPTGRAVRQQRLLVRPARALRGPRQRRVDRSVVVPAGPRRRHFEAQRLAQPAESSSRRTRPPGDADRPAAVTSFRSARAGARSTSSDRRSRSALARAPRRPGRRRPDRGPTADG